MKLNLNKNINILIGAVAALVIAFIVLTGYLQYQVTSSFDNVIKEDQDNLDWAFYKTSLITNELLNKINNALLSNALYDEDVIMDEYELLVSQINQIQTAQYGELITIDEKDRSNLINLNPKKDIEILNNYIKEMDGFLEKTNITGIERLKLIKEKTLKIKESIKSLVFLANIKTGLIVTERQKTVLILKQNMFLSLIGILVFMLIFSILNLYHIFKIQKVNKKFEIQNKKLEESNEQAELANKAKTLFISSISHELRTPLNSIIGFTQVIGEYCEGDKKVKEYVGYILKSGWHLLNLISEVLDFSKLESGTIGISIEKINIYSIVDENAYLFKTDLNKNNVVFKNYLPRDIFIMGDYTRLKQVILNLFSNSIKYSKKDGLVEIGLLNNTQDFCEIYLKDNGLGIKLDKQKELFKAFSRLGQEAGTIEGTGIGLSITKKLINLMSGEIWVESDGINFTTFKIKLPNVIVNSSNKIKIKKIIDNKQIRGLPMIFIGKNRNDVINKFVFRNDIKCVDFDNTNDALYYLVENKINLILVSLDGLALDSLKLLRNVLDTDEDLKKIKIIVQVETEDLIIVLNDSGFKDVLKEDNFFELEELIVEYI